MLQLKDNFFSSRQISKEMRLIVQCDLCTFPLRDIFWLIQLILRHDLQLKKIQYFTLPFITHLISIFVNWKTDLYIFSLWTKYAKCPSTSFAVLVGPVYRTGMSALQVSLETGRLLSHANDSSTSKCTASKLLRSSVPRTVPSRSGSKERVVIQTFFII